ncbi:MAG: four helix bundle protein [Firmicutes bacterium]|nr:four helix bundle protein [Bacillota bacterium]
MAKSILREKAKRFAISIIELNKFLNDKREKVLSKQILRSGTSIGANLSEAEFAQSPSDLINKSHVALKEASETRYWLELLVETDYISQEQFDKLFKDCSELINMLVSGIKTLKDSK